MIANHGYQDAEGEFYITIHTDACARCDRKPCALACPRSLLREEEDVYGDIAMTIAEGKRKKLQYECSPCKPRQDRPPLPCVAACPFSAIAHSW